MTERFVQIGTPQELLVQFAKEACQNPTIAMLIADADSASVADALIKAGIMQKGDILAVSFVVDDYSPQDSLSRRARIYSAHKTPEGTLVATKLIDECMLYIDFDREN